MVVSNVFFFAVFLSINFLFLFRQRFSRIIDNTSSPNLILLRLSRDHVCRMLDACVKIFVFIEWRWLRNDYGILILH